MAINHQISSYDRYHGAVKAQELRSQKQSVHGSLRAEQGEEGSKSRPQVRDVLERDLTRADGNGGKHERNGEAGHKSDQIRGRVHSRGFDSYDFTRRDSLNNDGERFSYGRIKNAQTGMYVGLQGAAQTFQFTQITITGSSIFSGAHLGSSEKIGETHQNFINAVNDFIRNPGEKAYKSLNDAMIKLMDPAFAPSVVGGAAQVSVLSTNRSTMVKLTMEITPAPTKTLDEAREALQDAFSTKRDGEKDIASIRAEAHADYIRALSEKFKQDGVISHTNNTPTTPVYASSVIYVAKVTQVNAQSFHEIRKPMFGNNLHGRLTFKDQRGFWNDYRQNHRSYVDLMRHGSRAPRIDMDFKAGRADEERRGYRNSDNVKEEKESRGRHHETRANKAS